VRSTRTDDPVLAGEECGARGDAVLGVQHVELVDAGGERGGHQLDRGEHPLLQRRALARGPRHHGVREVHGTVEPIAHRDQAHRVARTVQRLTETERVDVAAARRGRVREQGDP
jgi:hypothetical protein